MQYHTWTARITKPKAEPPLPAARLFIDDLEEIATHLEAARKAYEGRLPPSNGPTTFETGGAVYDSLAGLAGLAGQTRDLLITSSASQLSIQRGNAVLTPGPATLEEQGPFAKEYGPFS
jgi:hypothetical protein